MNSEQWSQDVAGLVADALRDARLIAPETFERAQAIVAEEIWVRLNLGDFPPRDPK